MQVESGKFTAELLDAAVDLMGHACRGGTVRVRGTSMEPTLTGGQLLAVEFTPRRLARGDLLLYRRADHLVVHRFLYRARFSNGRPCLRTRGDGLPALDPPLDPACVVGRVIALEDGESWRSFRDAGAQRYAWCLAWHDLFWAAVGVVARVGERALRKLRVQAPLRSWVAGVDRRLLRGVHRFCFRRLHAPVPKPEEAGG